MVDESKLRVGQLYKLTEDLGREIRLGGGEVTYKVFPADTVVKIIQTRPWIQVEAVDGNNDSASENFGVALFQIEELRNDTLQAQAA